MGPTALLLDPGDKSLLQTPAGSGLCCLIAAPAGHTAEVGGAFSQEGATGPQKNQAGPCTSEKHKQRISLAWLSSGKQPNQQALASLPLNSGHGGSPAARQTRPHAPAPRGGAAARRLAARGSPGPGQSEPGRGGQAVGSPPMRPSIREWHGPASPLPLAPQSLATAVSRRRRVAGPVLLPSCPGSVSPSRLSPAG